MGDQLLKKGVKMMTDIIVLCFTLAISLSFWIISVAISAYSGELALSHSTDSERFITHGPVSSLPFGSLKAFCVCPGTSQPASPWRWLFSLLVPLIITSRAYKKRSLDFGGCLGGKALTNLYKCVEFAKGPKSSHKLRAYKHDAFDTVS